MDLIKTQKEEEERRRTEDERRRKEEKEEEERRRKEEKEEEEKRRKEDEERHKEELQKIIDQIQTRSKADIEAACEEVRQEVHQVQQEVQKEIEMVREEFKELEQRVLKKNRDEISNQEPMIQPDSKAFVEVPATPATYRSLQPPTFDGETSWAMYKRQFEAAAITNGWNDQQKATALVLALRGKALEILQNIPEAKQEDYTTVVTALELRYGNKYLTQVYQCQLKSRVQGSTESLQEFGADIERIVRLAYPQAPEEFVNQISVQCFVDGIRDTELQQALRLGRFKNLSDALIYGLEFEAAKNASGYRKNKLREVKIDDASKCNAEDVCQKMEKLFEDLIQKYLNPDQRLRRERQVRCFNCGRQGHIKRNCRRSRSEERYKREQPQSDRRRDQGNALSPV